MNFDSVKIKNIFDLKDNRFHHFNSQERTPLLGGKLKSANGNNPLFEGELNRIGKYDKSILQIVIDDDFDDDENDPVPVPLKMGSPVRWFFGMGSPARIGAFLGVAGQRGILSVLKFLACTRHGNESGLMARAEVGRTRDLLSFNEFESGRQDSLN